MKILSATQYEPSVDRAKEREIARIRAGALVLPVLIHWGESDPSAPLDPDGLAVHRLLAGNVEDVALHVVNRAGHFGFREKFVEFNAHIAAFFDSKNL